jgi:hypothetical protein
MILVTHPTQTAPKKLVLYAIFQEVEKERDRGRSREFKAKIDYDDYGLGNGHCLLVREFTTSKSSKNEAGVLIN